MFFPFLRQSKGVALAAGLMAMTLCACNSSFVYEDLRPCIPEYKVRLRYDHNMAYEDRTTQVEAAEIYAFDEEGNYATSVVANRQTLIDNDWTLKLDLERFKKYDLVVWAGLIGESPFSLDGSRAVNSKADLTCRLNAITDEHGNQSSNMVFPPLFHGVKEVAYQVEDGPEVYDVPLKKNTNTIDVYLRKQNGEPVEENYYRVEITDANGVMDHGNNVSGDVIKYLHASFEATEYPIPDGSGNQSQQTSPAGRMQFHTARLMKDSNARIKITLGESGKLIFDDNLMDILLQHKASVAPEMDVQEYFDRQDTYKLDFVLRVEEKWSVVEIYVNDWLIVNDDVEWKK